MRKVVLHAAALLLLCFAPPILGPRLLHAGAIQAPGAQVPSDLDALMATVLQHRDENWRRLHDYVLREKEAFSLEGPGRARLYGSEREFPWSLELVGIAPINFYKIIELVIRAVPDLSREHVKHLNRVSAVLK